MLAGEPGDLADGVSDLGSIERAVVDVREPGYLQRGGQRSAMLELPEIIARYRASPIGHHAGQVASGARQCRAGSRHGARR